MPSLNKKVLEYQESLINEMSRLSDQYQAVNLAQGYPAFDMPPTELLKALSDTVYKGPHQYLESFGPDNFLFALADKVGKIMHRNISPKDEIVVTCGGTEGMICIMHTILNPGDTVMIFSPYYENYGIDVILAGGEPKFIDLMPPQWDIPFTEIEKGFKEGAKAIVVCNPSNPCSKVFSKEELIRIGELARQYDAYVITDEVYEHMVYPPYEHISVASLPGMFDNTITCNSLSKTYSITGWRIGYIIGPKQVIDSCKKVHDFLTCGAASPLLEAAVTALKFDDDYYRELCQSYLDRRNYFMDQLDKLGIKHNVPQGSYFMLIDIRDFLHLPQFKGYSDVDFCTYLIKEIGVAFVPGKTFFANNPGYYVRANFSRDKDIVDEAIRRLEKLSVLL